MTTPKNLFYLAIILAVIGGIAGLYLFKDTGKAPDIQNPAANGNEGQNNGNTLTEQLAREKMPDLDREIVISDKYPKEFKDSVTGQINDIRGQLKADYDSLQNWLQLGLLYKSAEDYRGAEGAWQFAVLIRPKDAVAFHNLGELYWLHMPDYPKAEEYFKKSIELSPMPLTYDKLYQLYRYSYKEKAGLADDVLLEGIEKNPKEPYLTYTLAQYYEETGNISQAIVYYEKTLFLYPDNSQLKQYVEKLKSTQ